jgi:hypothetical protein
MPDMTRRGAFRIMAAAAGLPLLIAGVRAAAPSPRFFTWQGEVLGAAAELTLWHADESLGTPHDPEGPARDRTPRGDLQPLSRQRDHPAQSRRRAGAAVRRSRRGDRREPDASAA